MTGTERGGRGMANVTGGDKAAAILAGMAKGGTTAREVAVGFLEGSTHTEKDGRSISLPLLAAINEFGRPDKGQPPRPFMRNTVAKNAPRWTAEAAAALKANNYNLDLTLEHLGQHIAGQVRTEILTLTSPPLAQSTIDRKGFDKPLVDTGEMSNSIAHAVRDVT